MRTMTLCLALVGFVSVALAEGELGFEERFALAPDRAAVLDELIPGTEDFYYYTCLYHQHAGASDKVKETLGLWRKRHGETSRYWKIRDRQALLDYGKDPKKALEHVRWRMGLQFNHQKEQLDRSTSHPTELDQRQISRAALQAREFRRSPKGLSGFHDSALDWLTGATLHPDQRRELLTRLTRPDYPGLVQLVVDDLKYRHSRGFGSLGIHKALLLSQLDALLKAKPDLLDQTAFVNAYLLRLRPGADDRIDRDDAVQQAYLDRLHTFVERLAPVHNSLKAHVRYHRLKLAEEQGQYDGEALLAYLAIPRPAPYMDQDYLRKVAHGSHRANLRQDFRSGTGLAPIGDDAGFVRRHLLHHLQAAEDYKGFRPYLAEEYLRQVFAEAKIVNGVGDPEQWASMLPPAAYQVLRDRVDIDFQPQNPRSFAAADAVAFDVAMKNVKSLIVKVYEINTENYYRTRGDEITTGIDLDGLVPNAERTIDYAQGPLLRHAERIEIPEARGPGVYVVELIGNGRSSRAVVRKGRLHVVARIGAAGHVFRVFDEQHERVHDVNFWVAGHAYPADEHGEVNVPFSGKPGREVAVISTDAFSVLQPFQHRAEAYELKGSIYVPRESLIGGHECTALVRAELLVHGRPVDLGLLEDVQLTMRSVDQDGSESVKTVDGFALSPDREATYSFRVPERLASLHFSLAGEVENLSLHRRDAMAIHSSYAVNGMEKTDKIEDIHLRRIAAGYVLELRGKTGEPRPDRALQIALNHRDFKEPERVTMQTDASARVLLGRLADIRAVQVGSPGGVQHTWSLHEDAAAMPDALHGTVGEVMRLPYMGAADAAIEEAVSLIETRNGVFVRDGRASARIEAGMLLIDDIAPGDYSLLLKRPGHAVTLRVTRADPDAGFARQANRYLELLDRAPLQMQALSVDDKALTVQLANAGPDTRVHLVATRFQPYQSPFAWMNAHVLRSPGQLGIGPYTSRYLSGRNIGDEYRYILERRYAAKFPGNMLTRPSLILNPWSLRKTDADKERADDGDPWADESLAMEGIMGSRRAGARGGAVGRYGGAGAGSDAAFASLRFLEGAAITALNLKPDKQGRVTIPREDLGACQQVHVVARGPRGTIYRSLALPLPDDKARDLRLAAQALDPDEHYTEKRAIDHVPAGEVFTVKDISSSQVEVYDSLPKVYRLLSALSGDPRVAEFGFLMDWPSLDEEARREKYKAFASHELHRFLQRKDPAFFDDVVEPYLANKKDPTFLDDYLLGRALDRHASPWAFGRLNAAERALFGHAVDGEADAVARHMRDRVDLTPPNMEEEERLFRFALQTGAFEDDSFGFEEAKSKIVDEKRAEVGLQAIAAKRMAPASLRESGRMDRAASAPAPAMERSLTKTAQKKGKAAMLTDSIRRQRQRAFFQKLDRTEEWVENNYYKLPIEQQVAALVPVDVLWAEYAAHDPKQPFVPTTLAHAGGALAEVMHALAAIDLPFEAPAHKTEFDGATMRLTPGGEVVVYHRQVQSAEVAEDALPFLVGQNFFARDDRYRHERGERFDKFVTKEFLPHRVYGAQVVLTNPTSSRRKVDVLLQIPMGAMPVLNGFYTRSLHLALEAFSTRTVEYYFYFPATGSYPHYPVHIAEHEQVVANAEPFAFNVVPKLTEIDRTSWAWISQHGSDADVLAYLAENNIDRLALDKIAFRLRDKAFHRQVVDLLRTRFIYHGTTWSYAVHHNDPEIVREYLPHESYAGRCGPYIQSALLTLDPVQRHAYQHKEYWPLVNARTYQLGARRRILNRQFREQYTALMHYMCHVPTLRAEDHLAAAVYLLLQDRVGEAIAQRERVRKIGTALQRDYLDAYLAFYRAEPAVAGKIAKKYADHPVERWRDLFRNVLAQVAELRGDGASLIDDEDRMQRQTRLADTAASLEFEVVDGVMQLRHRNVTRAELNLYLMDVELLFSRNPFVQDVAGQFSLIRPNHSEVVKLDRDGETSVDVPKAFRDRNVMLEVSADGVTRSAPHFPHEMVVEVSENYGQVRVTRAGGKAPLSTVYVKVYARMNGGHVQFFKDGYTDLRGRFDYTSLNTDELERVERFALLVMSDEHGSVVREVAPPKR